MKISKDGVLRLLSRVESDKIFENKIEIQAETDDMKIVDDDIDFSFVFRHSILECFAIVLDNAK